MLKKHCDKCGGDLYLERDIFSTEVVCLQCGRRHMLNQPTALARPALPEGRARRRRLVLR